MQKRVEATTIANVVQRGRRRSIESDNDEEYDQQSESEVLSDVNVSHDGLRTGGQ